MRSRLPQKQVVNSTFKVGHTSHGSMKLCFALWMCDFIMTLNSLAAHCYHLVATQTLSSSQEILANRVRKYRHMTEPAQKPMQAIEILFYRSLLEVT